jgi:hypothetical protein
MKQNSKPQTSGRKENVLSVRGSGSPDTTVCKFKNQVHLITIQDDATYDQDCEDNNSQEPSQEVEDSPELQISMHAI